MRVDRRIEIAARIPQVIEASASIPTRGAKTTENQGGLWLDLAPAMGDCAGESPVAALIVGFELTSAVKMRIGRYRPATDAAF